MRRTLAALGGALLFLLPACGREAGPTPGGQPQDPGPGALAVKLDAQMTDICYRQPAQADPPGCEKYVTQLGSLPGTAQKYAGTTHPGLADAGARLAKGVAAFRAGGCDSAANDPCAGALTEIASAIKDVRAGLVPLTTGG